MRRASLRNWIWYAVLVAVVAGLFAPNMFASAGGVSEVPVRTCPVPKL